MNKQVSVVALAAVTAVTGGAGYFMHASAQETARRTACKAVKSELMPLAAAQERAEAQLRALRAKHIDSNDPRIVLADMAAAQSSVQVQSIGLQHSQCFSAADMTAAKGALTVAQGRIARDQSRLG
jgi:hypothetical protein